MSIKGCAPYCVKGVDRRTRFDELTLIAGPDDCWLWIGERRRQGYGMFWFYRKMMAAHRMAWIYNNGEIPENMDVCHKCDNPACVNPNHLFLGTHQENMKDAKLKGRMGGPKGEKQPTHKLKEKQVIEIIRIGRRGGVKHRDIAKIYGVSQVLVSKIIKRKLWRCIDDAVIVEGAK